MAENLEGTSGRGGGDTYPFLFLLQPFRRSFRYCSTLISPIPFPHSFALIRPLYPVGWPGDALKALTVPSKVTASCKRWMEPNTLGPDDLQSWRGRVSTGHSQSRNRKICKMADYRVIISLTCLTNHSEADRRL